MSSELLERRFAAIGARVKVAKSPWRGEPRIDIRADARGAYFDIDFVRGEGVAGLEVVDVQARDRHLLLLARVDGEKSKFLCGHDERHWFVAAIPEGARGVTGVVAAKAALQPPGYVMSSSELDRRIRSAVATSATSVRASGSSFRPRGSIRRRPG